MTRSISLTALEAASLAAIVAGSYMVSSTLALFTFGGLGLLTAWRNR